jgi:hypothetical protein
MKTNSCTNDSMNGNNSGQVVRSASSIWQIRFHVLTRIELVVGGPTNLMKNTLAAIEIINELSYGVVMLFIEQILLQHSLVVTDVAGTDFINDFKPSGLLCAQFLLTKHTNCTYFI